MPVMISPKENKWIREADTFNSWVRLGEWLLFFNFIAYPPHDF